MSAAGTPLIQDVMLTGFNLKEVGAMVIPSAAVRALAGLASDAPMQQALVEAMHAYAVRRISRCTLSLSVSRARLKARQMVTLTASKPLVLR